MSGTQTEQKIESHNNIFQIRLLSLASAPDPEMWIIQGTLAWRTSPVRTGEVFGRTRYLYLAFLENFAACLWCLYWFEQMMISLLHIRIGFKEEVALLQAMED
ncbi:hypothetical protein V6N13_136135 [Hibiscus sabdariffa]